MKRVHYLFLTIVMLLSMCACSNSNNQTTDPSGSSQSTTNGTAESTTGNTETPTDGTEGTQAPTDEPTTAPTDEPTTAPTDEPTTPSTQTSTSCNHSWKDATCTVPKTCSKCGATTGSALGHSYKDATCTAPKTCTKCGTTEGSTVDHKYTDGKCSSCGKEDIVNPIEHFTPANYVSLEERDQSLSVILLIWHGEEYELADTLYVKTGGDPDDFIDYKGERYYASGGGGPSFTYRLTDTYIEFIDPGDEPCAKYAIQHDGSLRLIALEDGWSLPSLFYKGTLDELLSKLN